MLVAFGERDNRPFTKNREVGGPAPYSFGVICKPRKVDTKLESYKKEKLKRENALLEAIRQVTLDNRAVFQNGWVSHTKKKFEKNFIQDRVNEVLNNEEVELDAKRLRLRDMLHREENALIREMQEITETPDMRHERNKVRANELKAKREAERLQYVAEQREVQWINKCEEIRTVLSRRHCAEVFRDRGKQIQVKHQMLQRKAEEEAMYAEMWEKDRLAKAATEEMGAKLRIKRNEDQVHVLDMQVSRKKTDNMDSVKVKTEQAKLLKVNEALRALEEEREWNEKKRKQHRNRSDLQSMMRYKVKRAALERQEELALDMKILQQCLQESRDEEEERKQRKSELRDETLQYLQYLSEQSSIEATREKELELMLDADIRAMWEKRREQYRIEREARAKLMREVMAVRKLQIQEKLEAAVLLDEEQQRDRIVVAKAVEEHMLEEEERRRRVAEKNRAHQRCLRGQLEFEEEVANAEKLEERREYEEGLRTEAVFQEKMKQVLMGANSHFRQHPMRKNMDTPKLSINGLSIL